MKIYLDNFFILTFIIIIAVIYLVPDKTNALLLIMLLINAALIYRDAHMANALVNIGQSHLQPPAPAPTPIVSSEIPPVEAPASEGDPTDLYGGFYEKWAQQRQAYTDSYKPPLPRVATSCAERNYDVDAANTLIWQKRTHDKQRNDGWAAKGADYFAYHYADELNIEEAKRWWGNDEF